MRKLSRREAGLLGLLGVALVGVTLWALRHPGAPTVLGGGRAERPLPPVPRIALARVDTPRPQSEAGRRDLFTFGSAREAEQDEETPVEVAKTPPPPAGALAGGAPGEASASVPVVPSLPPLTVYYIGSVENKAGVKVAVLMTDRKEVLTGQAGQVVANRYRIARIGLESVDLEDVGSGQSRRIPLKGK